MNQHNKLLFCFFSVFISCFPIISRSQTLEAHYKVSQEMYYTQENGMQKNIATLEYDGFLYQQNNRFISFKKPLYIDKYPDGYIYVTTGENNNIAIGLMMDTIQRIDYTDLDSLITRTRADLSGKGYGFNMKQKLIREKWQILPDTKQISGLKCQKAQYVNTNGQLQWVVWFCPDIPTLVGPDGISDLPGLVVEGENKILNESYVLESYKSNVAIPAKVFWPDEFNQPFR